MTDQVTVDLRGQFLRWQCRIRQIAMRQDAGRPSPAMCPRVLVGGAAVFDAMTTVLVPMDPHESTAFFKHQVRRTHDPRETREKAMQLLQSTHFQSAERFSDELTAVLPPASEGAATLLEHGQCVLQFEQFNQTFTLTCHVRRLGENQDAYQATIWHNRLFNPALPDGMAVLGFKPDWARSSSSQGG